MDIINIYENYNSYFNDNLKKLFDSLSKSAAGQGVRLYLIGGMVRDMLLDMHTRDIDITIEGDAIKFAEFLESESVAKISSRHECFGTVKIEFMGHKIDLASTRSELYPKKGHLPHVDEIGCGLEKDVLRRDFTINALAMSLNQDNFADLIDYTGGFEDLKSKKIKILHDKSFIDDPTRIIRALKYSTRLGFELDKSTLKLQEKYLSNINYDMCYKRIKQEIKKTFEQNSQKAFDKFIGDNIYKLITNHAKPISANIENLNKTFAPKHPWLVYFGVLALQGDIKNISLTKYETEVIDGAKSLTSKSFSNDLELYKAFRPQKLEALLILASLGKEKEVLHYLNNLSKIKLHIDGNDLIKLGFKPSRKFSQVFDYILEEKFKNLNIVKEDELKLAKKYLN